MSDGPSSQLKLGWQVTPAGQPRYWLRTNAKLGQQRDTDLVQVQARDMAAHAVIVAQSGSGKSFFLGRLVEELMISTKANCVILDPNADFARIGEIDNRTWESARYDPDRDTGRLPTERSASEFTSLWRTISKHILTAQKAMLSSEQMVPDVKCTPIRLWWLTLPVECMMDGLSPTQSLELYYCHEIARLVYTLIKIKSAIEDASNDVGVRWDMPKDQRITDFDGIQPFYDQWRNLAVISSEIRNAGTYIREDWIDAKSARQHDAKRCSRSYRNEWCSG